MDFVSDEGSIPSASTTICLKSLDIQGFSAFLTSIFSAFAGFF